jgi:N-acetylmuramoyl-L-alanine amidase
MSRIFQAASAAAVGLTALTAIALTVPGLAQVATEPAPGDVIYESLPVIGTTVPAIGDVVSTAEPAETAIEPATVPRAASLAAMVANMDHLEPEDEQLRCLATGVYFESKGESLDGQLAVAHVIINRANSGRFAASHCGVLTQRGQFSFVRGGVIPRATHQGQWRTAVAIARIAMADEWANPVPGAMFFHAARVSPGWNRPRVARLGNHVFYR